MQNKNLKNYIGIMPMAGEGQRFKKHGYLLPKPLIKINNTPMFLKATKSFPKNFTLFTFCLGVVEGIKTFPFTPNK